MISATLISDLRATTKPSEKQKILEDNNCEFLKYILKATFEAFELYHVSIKAKEVPPPGLLSADDLEVQESIRNLIEYCRVSKSAKKNRYRTIEFLSALDKDAQDLTVGILSKSWKAGLSSKTVQKVFPNLTTQFEVQLANSLLKVRKKKSYKPKDRYCSYKLDGIRCIFIREDEGIWKALSRQGKEFLTVDHLKPQLEVLWKMHGIDWWDGELYCPGLIFEDIQGMVMSFTTGTSFDLEYRVFMCGDKKAFFDCAIYDKQSFQIVTEDHVNHPDALKIVVQDQWLITEEQIEVELEKAFELGHEGIMLRDPDVLYDFKRSDALIKLKESASAESQELISDALVLDIVIGDFPVIIDGAIVYKNLLTKLIVEQENGKVCTVGSGFSLDFRKKCTKDPLLIIGKVVEVKNQGLGNKGRMRFPRLFRERGDLAWKSVKGL
jgi:DNA ligase-1